jgi:hypothetical protein
MSLHRSWESGSDIRFGRAARASTLLLALLLAGCEPQVSMLQPEAAERGPSLVLTLLLEDEALAARLGWENGVPGAQVWLQREKDPEVLVLESDSLGVVTVPTLRTGLYWIWGERRLSAAERELAGEDVWVFGGGQRTSASMQSTRESALLLGTEEPGSLVIEEVAYGEPHHQLTGGWAYFDARYVKLRNNGEDVQYLDGKLLLAHNFAKFDTQPVSCDEWEFRNGPDHLCAIYGFRFPGGGGDHPVLPGESVLIAAPAIDHEAVHPGLDLPDLRGAHFELPSGGNPAVPNLIDVSPVSPASPWSQAWLSGTGPALMLHEGVAPAAIPRVRDQRLGREYLQLSPVGLLDAVHAVSPYTAFVSPNPLCAILVDPTIDRLASAEGFHSQRNDRYSLTRRGIPEAGRLQRTRTSMLDFSFGLRSVP